MYHVQITTPLFPASYYLDTVKSLGFCPKKIRTDYGTENGIMAGGCSLFSGFKRTCSSVWIIACAENRVLVVSPQKIFYDMGDDIIFRI